MVSDNQVALPYRWSNRGGGGQSLIMGKAPNSCYSGQLKGGSEVYLQEEIKSPLAQNILRMAEAHLGDTCCGPPHFHSQVAAIGWIK